ncbi:MAG: zinc metallopeptidase [Alistipes sp.]|nr:zinc metallopeptidase [Alistipes sp.]
MFEILTNSVPEATNGFMSSFSSAGSLILMIIIGIAGFVVQSRLQSVFQKYSKVTSPGGMTGAELAEKMLHDHGIYNVKVTHVKGHLTDHFNPVTMTVNLSDSVYSSRSIAAAAVACHECGHAVQHATGYGPIKLRSRLVPIVSFSSQIATWVLLAGIVMMAATQSTTLCWIGIGLITISAIFSIVTLPVEYNASERALAWLENSGTLDSREMEGARTSLRWAARTYLVAALSAIATILYYVTLIMARRD